MICTKKQKDNLLVIIAVVWMILSSNALVYCIFNMKLCMLILGIIAGIFFLKNPKILSKNIYVIIIISIVLILNMVLNLQYVNLNESIIILLYRSICLMIIMSNIELDQFKEHYIKIMVVLAIISIVSFILVNMGITLPFQRTVLFKDKYYIYTFYYTLGRWSIQLRNSGIFWEPGGYQIYLNIALLFLLTDAEKTIEKIGKKKYIIEILILVATVLTTMSTTGFLCLGIVFAIGVLHQDKDVKVKRFLLIIIAIAAIALIIVELKIGVIESKAINQEGSFTTRYNDTISSFKIGLDRLWGYGLGNTYTPTILRGNGVTDNSSGLGSLIVSFGFIIAIIYLIYVSLRLKQICRLSFQESILALILFLLFVMSENVYPITLFVSFLFFWRRESYTKKAGGLNGTKK